ncbi:hypothetical protein DAPPUDRAFT_245429 [Daphnia pulex]|uniref:Uncharacterized protein n=1 Tax=Daphnia pulex TaxID=6669 RepID=E9GNC4_DAPPU|nr:hypothetical protein DAPPUDRAFT_245429 [Daphnia pulex]|eukprot:EFX79054.1 hypothetical protein DAPPUDRAFT_245429 [Daphnia pulex]
MYEEALSSMTAIPIDITLEQTINADAAGRFSAGIASSTNSLAARQRWAMVRYLQTSVVSYLLDKVGMSTKDDASRESHPSRIKKDKKDFDSVVEFMENCINPFSSEAQDLVNISRGKVASEETTRFLLNVMSNGEKMRDEFIQNFCNDPESFERPIRRQRLQTFASEGVRIKKTRTDGKVQELTMERDLFGRILVIALEEKVDIRNVLEYPLTPVPLCFSHLDGHMNKTNKAKTFKILEDRVKHQPPTNIDVVIIDGFFFLHLCPDLPSSFGKSSRHILQRVCAFRAKTIHLIFDRVTSPSIKDMEQDKRTDSDRDVPFKIAGDNQLRPTDFIKALRNNNFKRELGDMVPTTIEDIILDSSNEEEKDEDATDVSSDEADDESDCSLSDVD